MSDADLSKRLSFLNIDAETRALLQDMRPVLQAELPKILDLFYTHIRQWQDVSQYFGGATHMDHAKNAQLRHWLLIAEGSLDTNYVTSVRKIGMTHARIGLAPRWYIGGYAFITSELQKMIIAGYGLCDLHLS
jgi:hemoglobin-like flavoprotein